MILAHLLLFQLGWFACVLGAAAGYGILGPLAVAVICFLNRRVMPVDREMPILATLALFGFAVDSSLAASGLVGYASSGGLQWLAPPWIVALWVNFGLTVRRSLSWLKGRPWLAAVLGGVLGPLAYMGARELGAVQMTPPLAIPVLSMVWASTLTYVSNK
ncbi:MAG TPA: DUF2878 domain-containing protein [Vicinamibacteria bacterium]|nr:DUF2878 domain-containing protein [Vicinamibacteria bacterium]